MERFVWTSNLRAVRVFAYLGIVILSQNGYECSDDKGPQARVGLASNCFPESIKTLFHISGELATSLLVVVSWYSCLNSPSSAVALVAPSCLSLQVSKPICPNWGHCLPLLALLQILSSASRGGTHAVAILKVRCHNPRPFSGTEKATLSQI